MQAKPWRWTARALAPSNTPDGRKVKCEVRLLDTVFLDESSGKVEGGDWLFTSKHGTVTLKKQEQVTVQKVVDRFGRFAMMNPLNTDQFVARLLPSEQNAESSSGDGRLLNLAELEGFLASGNGSEKGVALQVFLRPRDGKSETYMCEYIAGGGLSGDAAAGGAAGSTRVKRRQLGGGLRSEAVVPADWEPAAKLEVEGCCRAVARHVELTHSGLKVEHLRCEFMLDDNHQPWLTLVPSLHARHLDRSEAGEGEVPGAGHTAARGHTNDGGQDEGGQGMSGVSLPRIPSRGAEASFDGGGGSNGESRGGGGGGNDFRPVSEPLQSSGGGGLTRMGSSSSRGGIGSSGSMGGTSLSSRDGSSFVEQKQAMRQHLASRSQERAESAASAGSGGGGGRGSRQGLRGVTPLMNAEVVPGLSEDTTKEGGGRGEGSLAAAAKGDRDDQTENERRVGRHSSKGSGLEAKGERALRERYANQAKPGGNKGKPGGGGGSKQAEKQQQKKKQQQQQQQQHGLDGDRIAAFASGLAQQQQQQQQQQEQQQQMAEKAAATTAVVVAAGEENASAVNHSVELGLATTVDANVAGERGGGRKKKRGRAGDRAAEAAAKREDRQTSEAAAATLEKQLEGEHENGGSQQATEEQKQQEAEEAALLAKLGRIAGGKHQHHRPNGPIGFEDTGDTVAGGSVDSRVGSGDVRSLRHRIAELSKALAVGEKRLLASSEQRLAALDQAKDLARKLASAQAEFAHVMAEKDEASERRALALEEQHHFKLTQVLASTSGVQGSPALTESSKETSLLISRVDALGKDLSEQARTFSGEKRRLASESAAKLQEAAAEHRLRLQQEAARTASLEDGVAALEAELGEAKQALKNWQTREEDSALRRQEVEQQNEALATEIRALQQSFAAATSLDVAQGEGGGVRDGEATIAALSAQSEARIRQLNNKVEFLKASLAGEQQRFGEVEQSLAVARQRLDGAHQELKKRAQQASADAREAGQRAEQAARVQVDDALAEAATLQQRNASLQAQLGDALNDVASAKRREEGARQEAGNLQSRLEQAEQVQEGGDAHYSDGVVEARKREEAADAKRAAAEALLRRLDNERAYLRSQLTSEVTLKNELQATLDQATRSLGELKQTSSSERDGAEGRWARERVARDASEADLKNANMELASESGERGRQLEATRSLFAKTRDQLRLDQASLESLRAVNRRLVDELKASQEELSSATSTAKLADQRASDSMAQLAQAVEGNSAATSETITCLRAELQRTTLAASNAQKDMLSLKANALALKHSNAKERAAARIHRGLQRLARGTAGHALATWRRHAQAVSFEAFAKERVGAALKEKAVEAEAEKAAAVAALSEALKKERENLVIQYSAEAAAKQAEAVAVAVGHSERAASKQAKEAAESARARVEGLEKEMASALRAQESENQATLQRKDEEAGERAAVAVRETARRALEDKQEALLGAEERWRCVVAEREGFLRREKEASLEAAAEESDRVLAEHTEALRQEKERLEAWASEQQGAANEDAARARLECATEVEARASAEQVAEGLRAGLLRQAEDHKAMLEVEKEEAVREGRVAWAQELEALRVAWDAEHEAKVQEALSKEREVQADTRGKAVKLEGAKWSRSMGDLERRTEAERQANFRRGAEEAKKQASEDMGRLKEAAGQALEGVKVSAKQSLEGAMQDSKEHAKRAHKAGQEQGRTEAEKEASAREQAVKHEHELLSASALALAAEARMKAVDAIRDEERRRLDEAKAEHSSQREQAAREAERLASRARELETSVQELKAEAYRASEAHREALDEARESSVLRRDQAVESAQRMLRSELEERRRVEVAEEEKAKEKLVKEVEERVASEMGDAMATLQDESEKLIGQLEDRLASVRLERDDKARELAGARNESEEAGDTIYDLNNAVKAAQEGLSAAEDQARAEQEEAKIVASRALKRAKEEWQQESSKQATMAEERFSEQQQALAEAEGLIADAEHYREAMHDTLVNHKREALLGHQTQSAGLQKALEAVAQERDDLEARKDLVLDELSEMERGVKSVEGQLREHAQTSAVTGGRINVAYQRKKKRLDEEYEALLAAIQEKRLQVDELDKKIEDCEARSRAKEEALKSLERQLVEVLVEQQKRLLRTLTDAGQANAKYQKEKEKKAMVTGGDGGQAKT